ncbi:MAG: hypothetical protein HWE35_11795 [Rhodobacteraceae bacterium]|nr:hypothetical protein [Paracoccaceae bacterium]
MQDADLRAGAENLLVACAGLAGGNQLLILREDSANGYYDAAIAEAVQDTAQALGIGVASEVLPFDPMGATLPAGLVARMKAVDRVLFLSRSGDQIRFSADMQGIRPIMSYALDAGMLASGFGRANYQGFVALKDAVNRLMAAADHIRLTCPLGTDFSGPGVAYPETGAADVSVTRFPMSVFAPVPAQGFSGVVMQDGFLVGTGSKFYEPYGCELRQPLAVHFQGSVLQRFEGHEMDVHCARMHYAKVGQQFGLDPMTMHSWHAGIHPGCAYGMAAAENYERWSGGAFGNPRLMHFHTCGHYAPGEISLNVLDPTIEVDGAAVWKGGVFDPHLVPGGAEILAQYPCIRAVFEQPAQEVGQGPAGRLAS